MHINDISDEDLQIIIERLHSGKKTNHVQDNVMWRLGLMEIERRKEKLN